MTRFYSETEVVARVRGLTVTRLRSFVAAECLAPAEREGRLAFAEVDVARVQLLEELVEDFDLDAEAAAVVVSLVDQIHGLRRAAAPARRGGGRGASGGTGAHPGSPRENRRVGASGSGPGLIRRFRRDSRGHHQIV